MSGRPYSEAELEAMDTDPRLAACYFSGRARYARLQAARIRALKAKGYDTSAEVLAPDGWDALQDVLNEWARRKMAEAAANPELRG